VTVDLSRLRGSCPPLVTPFDAAGGVDLEAFAALVEAQVAGGSHGILVNGTTAEPSSLTVGERNRLVDTAIAVAAARIPVIAATGSQSHAETVALTAHAEAAGADALLIVTPYYIRPSQDGLLAYYDDLCGRTRLPTMLYHIPGRAAVSVTMDTLSRLRDRHAHFVGAKHATTDIGFVTEARQRLGTDFRIFVGLEEFSWPMLALGAAGLMNAAGNLVPGRIAALFEAAAAGRMDDARALHEALFDLNRAIFFDTNPVPLKYMLLRMGRLRANHHRLPLLPASREIAARCDKVLVAAGLLEAAAHAAAA
jgi:4-hydroxy-tetrahydrodipicolinate synthase